jgi:UDP-2,3-diacylglucosamine pyrophosphatase LpxH
MMPILCAGGETLIDDLQPIIHKFPNHQDIKVYPIADLHVGSPQFDVKRWDIFRTRLRAEPNSRIMIAGDMINNGIKSSKSNTYEETMRPHEQKRWLAEQLKPIADRILCGCSGNHEQRTSRDVDQYPLYDVFSKLDIEHLYRENGCFVIMRFGSDHEQNGLTRPSYCTYVTHGTSGGMYVGSSMNKSERLGMSIDGLDCIITGHSHHPAEAPVAKLFVDKRNNRVIEQQFRMIVATSWLRYGGYGLRAMYTPTAFALQEIVYSSDEKLLRVTS